MLTVFDYTNKFTLKCTIHPFIYSIKLKLEFIVLNQLQTLVKRGLAPGLSLGSNIAPSGIGSERSSNMTPAVEKPVPVFERGFITKTGVSPSLSLKTDSCDERIVRHGRTDSDGTLLGEEMDLKDIVGRPDGAGGLEKVDDIERLYLGRWDGEGMK
jgi:hypothetical protein